MSSGRAWLTLCLPVPAGPTSGLVGEERGGTLPAMTAQRSRVDERPLTSDWFPIERLVDSPVLHVFAVKEERFGTEEDAED
jgi:hypothetical protein